LFYLFFGEDLMILPRAHLRPWSSYLQSHIAGITNILHHAQLLVKIGVSLTFCWGWPQTVILPIFTFPITGIIGVSQLTQPKSFFSHLILWVTSSSIVNSVIHISNQCSCFLPFLSLPSFFFVGKFEISCSAG
jgi:hypothetical protein